MAVRFLLDEQVSPRVAGLLIRSGLDTVAVAGSRLSGLDDDLVFRTALGEGRILVTYDIGDFVAIYRDILKEGVEIPGLVLVDPRTIPTSAIGRLARALQKLARAIEENAVDPRGGIFLTD